MLNIRNIKLIIWDLDETLWNGTLTEGSIQLNEMFDNFINDTLDAGIIHSICSKNEPEMVNKKLTELGILDNFVFISVNWEPKGKRIEQTIQDMGLRACNVLFVDDNIQNLQEAAYYCPGIMTALPEEMTNFIAETGKIEKSDTMRNRLRQYKVLEEKRQERKQYTSNEDFLISSKITVSIKNDCLENISRIADLVSRSNQLNYTKKRDNKEELKKLFCDPEVNCGYVSVRDKFGDYGIVGFFAIKDRRCIHYLFSCRTLGMRIEQYVYMQLECPTLVIVGDVVSDLNNYELPTWINQNGVTLDEKGEKKKVISERVLIKGPCDLEQTFSFIEDTDKISTEFSYVGENGMLVEGHNHTAQMLTGLTISEERKKQLINKYPWFDQFMFDSKIKKGDYGFVIFSMLTDGALGVYRRKDSGEMVAFCSAYYDLTNPENWDLYLNNRIPHCNIPFTRESLSAFSEEFEWIDNRDGNVTIECLAKIYDMLNLGKKTKLILILGSENNYNCGEIKYKEWTTLEYQNRNVVHKKMNEKIEMWAKEKENVYIIKLDSFIHNDNDYLDTINHFVKRVYFDLAGKLTEIINMNTMDNISRKHKSTLRRIEIIEYFGDHPKLYLIMKPGIQLFKKILFTFQKVIHK